MASRGPLRFIVLNQSGQDVSNCSQCECCECQFSLHWDLRPCQVIQMIREDDEQVLSSKTVWSCQDCQECHMDCPNDIDFGAIAYALRQEAQKRGIMPPANNHQL